LWKMFRRRWSWRKLILFDETRCEIREKGICVKCKEYEDSDTYYCANSVFGCLETFIDDCLKCDDLSSIYACTEYYKDE